MYKPWKPLYGRNAHAVLVYGLGERGLVVVVRQQPQHLGEVLPRLALVLVPACVQVTRDRTLTQQHRPVGT